VTRGEKQALHHLRMPMWEPLVPARCMKGQTGNERSTPLKLGRRLAELEEAIDDPDAPWVERARRGDQEAFGELVRRHQQGALRLAAGLCGSVDEAHDVVQEGFVKAYLALDRFRAEASFRPWVMTIIANEARNRRRSAARRAALGQRATDRGLLAAPGDDPEDRAIASDAFASVMRAIDTLSSADRSVIACRYFAGLSEGETAEVLGCRPGTVKSRNSRALARLRAEMGVEVTR
jgi:RNA polymerase sigma factor (sigma-70 family)